MDGSRERKEEVIQYLLNKVDEVGNDGDTVMIGDTAFDVRGAAELGIPCIGVTWGFGDLNEMREAGAIGIVETMEQLYEMVK
jgi:phosphoglycolate phosphatase